MRVAHVITGLETGGAEMMLLRLLSGRKSARMQASVISLTGLGALGPRIAALGVSVRAIGMRPGVRGSWDTLRLASLLRQEAPDLIQTWLSHANVIGGLAARLAGGRPVLWSLHNPPLRRDMVKPRTRWMGRVEAWLAHRLPDHTVCCAESVRQAHAAVGYPAERMSVIPNGFDLSEFRPDPAARGALRGALGLDADAPLIGMAGRFDPQKDHANFIRAAALLHARRPEVHFVLCGSGITPENKALAASVDEAGLASRFHLLGRRDDMPALHAGLDVASLSSYSEAFPLAVGEAMACGVPCVVTDVGDAAWLVSETGLVVPPRDPAALAAAWDELLALDAPSRQELGMRARARLSAEFSLDAIAGRYADLYDAVRVARK